MKVKKVALRGYYNLDGEYLLFDDNPHHGKTFNDVNIEITQEVVRTIPGPDGDTNIVADVVAIEGYEPIECELVRYHFEKDGTLMIGICQDWG